MFTIAFSAVVILALVSIVVHWTMRIRLMRLDSARDRIEWLSFHGGDDVLNTYEALFPRSVLPRFCRLVFWTAIVIAAVGLCAVVILKVSGPSKVSNIFLLQRRNQPSHCRPLSRASVCESANHAQMLDGSKLSVHVTFG